MYTKFTLTPLSGYKVITISFMMLFSLIFACVPEQTNDGFGMVNTTPDRTLDTSEEDDNSSDTIGDGADGDAVLEKPFATESGSVCGDRTVGTEVGDCAVNFGLIDRNGEVIELHSYVGSVLFLDLSGFG